MNQVMTAVNGVDDRIDNKIDGRSDCKIDGRIDDKTDDRIDGTLDGRIDGVVFRIPRDGREGSFIYAETRSIDPLPAQAPKGEELQSE